MPSKAVRAIASSKGLRYRETSSQVIASSARFIQNASVREAAHHDDEVVAGGQPELPHEPLDEDATGRRTVKQVPLSSWLSTVTSPPW